MKAKQLRRPLLIALLLSALFGLSLQGAAQSQSPRLTVLRAARMIDVRSGSVVNNAFILVEDGRIKQVGTSVSIPVPFPPGTEIIDLGNVTVMPGLIDCHTHLLQNYDGALGGDDPNMILTVTQLGTVKRALLGVKMGQEDLEAGITTVRDLGNSGLNGDVALRDAIRAGWVTGPRIVAAT